MDEHWERNYSKEEEFLDDFPNGAGAAARLLDGTWSPNYHCDDKVRGNRQYFLSTGELNQLVFDSADVYHDQHGFSSVQILLRSAKRIVNVRVRKVGHDLVAEKLVDKQPSDSASWQR
jgi:hypothetical protein